jgi:hypothetical protein
MVTIRDRLYYERVEEELYAGMVKQLYGGL